jgi:hypothetical protein
MSTKGIFGLFYVLIPRKRRDFGSLQYKFYSENMATDFPRREVKVILKDGTDDCPFLPKRNTKNSNYLSSGPFLSPSY